MPKLPILSGLEVVKALTKNGFLFRSRKGSHVVLVKDGRLVTVPQHYELTPFVLSSIIRQTGMEREVFLKLFK